MAKKKVTNTISNQSYLKPSIKHEGHLHPFEKLTEDEMPVIKAVGYTRVPGTNTFVSYKLKTQGSKVLEMEIDEPNLRALAEEASKIAFVDDFMQEEF